MIKPLTSLRFLFAFMVFTSHLSFLKESENEAWRWIYNNVFYEGYIGVSFFFILSGFILAYKYENAFLNKRVSKQQFYIARFARIYPLHLFTFILAIPLTIQTFFSDEKIWLIKALTNSALLQSYIPIKNIYFSFNAPSWSISDEMFFYLLFPFIVLLLYRIFQNRYKKILFFASILLFPLLTLVVPKEYFHAFFYIHPFFRIIDFVLGIGLYLIFEKGSILRWNMNYNILEILSIFVLILFLLFHSSVPKVARYSYYYWLPMGLIIFIFAFQRGIISKFLSKKIFFYLGEISYGFYMFHGLVLAYFVRINRKILYLENEFLIIGIVFVLTLISSSVSYRFIETPANKYIKRVCYKSNRKTKA